MAILEHGGPPSTGAQIIRGGRQVNYFNLSGDHYQKIRQLVTQRYNQAEQYTRSKYERFYRWEKLVHMVSKKKIYDWKANAFLPYAFAISEQSAAIKWLALFGSRPFISVQARLAELKDIAERRQALLDWHLTGDEGFLETSLQMFRICERYGKALALVVPEWDQNLLKYRSREELPTAMGPLSRIAWKMQEKRDYKIRIVHLDNTDFKPEPGKWRINGPKGMRWCFRTYNLVMDELLQLQAAHLIGPDTGGQRVEDIKETPQQDLNEYKLRRMFLDKYDDVDRYYDRFDRNVELIENQTVVPDELLNPEIAERERQMGFDPKRRIYVVANKHVVLMDIALPWDHGMWSFIEMDCVPDPYDFWGKGKIEPIEHLNYVGNEIVNLRVDNVKQAVNGLIGVDSNRMPHGWKRRLVSQPWGVVETYGPPSEIVHRLPFGDVTASSYQEQQQIFTLIQEASSVNEIMMGAPGPARTLGEHQLKAEAGSRRLQFELVGQAHQLLGYPTGLAKFLIALDRQYLPIPTYFSLLNPDSPDDFMEINVGPEVLAEEDERFLYLPTSVTEGMNIQAKRADMAELLKGLVSYKDVLAATQFNFVELFRMAFKVFGHDPDKFFPKVQGAVGPEGSPALQAAGQAQGAMGRGAPSGTPGVGGPRLQQLLQMAGGLRGGA